MTERKLRPAVKTTRDSVQTGNTTIDFEVRRSRRRKKGAGLKITDDGLCVLVPWRATRDQVRRLVLESSAWILKNLAEHKQRPRLRFVTGETLPYVGRDLTLHIDPSGTEATKVHLEDGRLHVSTPAHLPEAERHSEILRAVKAWYSARAAERLAQLFDDWWPRLGRGEKSRAMIGDQRSRWASCAADGTLRFSWRVMTLEPDLIDYIVVHELAHLSVRNHSPAFWAVVAQVMPDAKAKRARLRAAARTLPF